MKITHIPKGLRDRVERFLPKEITDLKCNDMAILMDEEIWGKMAMWLKTDLIEDALKYERKQNWNPVMYYMFQLELAKRKDQIKQEHVQIICDLKNTFAILLQGYKYHFGNLESVKDHIEFCKEYVTTIDIRA